MKAMCPVKNYLRKLNGLVKGGTRYGKCSFLNKPTKKRGEKEILPVGSLLKFFPAEAELGSRDFHEAVHSPSVSHDRCLPGLHWQEV